MKRKLSKKLLCILLSGILTVTGYDIPTVHAAEEETLSLESMTDSIESQTDPQMSAEELLSEDGTPTEEQQTENETTDESESRQEHDTVPEEQQTEAVAETTESFSDAETSEETQEAATDIEITVETEAYDEESYSFIAVNPLYEGIIDSDTLAAELDALRSKSRIAAQSASETFDNFETAAGYLREQMVARETTVSIQVSTSVVSGIGTSQEFYNKLFAAATEHTEECSGQEGDALAWVYGGSSTSIKSEAGTYTYELTISYYTTYEQELELTEKVNQALDSLALDGQTDYQKIKSIHDYICDHVDYDYDNLETASYKLKFTAYAALCNGTAVCQGYAVLFYRMCKDAGLPVRVITGTGNGGAHAWNIVKMSENQTGGKYYNIDCTWDGQDSETRHTYFLLNESDFVDHTREDEYNTAEFHAKYPMAETSYIDESQFEAGLNKDNPDVSFTTIDDASVRSATDGKPKLIVFFSATCGNSMNTIKAISGHNFPDVDIYAAEINKAEKETVINFKNTYGSDSITFLYDTANGINTSLWNYVQLGGLTSGSSMSVTLPVLCYIDADNMFQYISQGFQNASTIEAYLSYYCGVTPTRQYLITYVLDGGTNHSDNPSSYFETSDTIILKAPTKTGYTFAGWYLDAAFTQQITQIEQGSSGAVTLYAKWENITQPPEDPSGLPQVDMTLTEGNILMGISGAYETETAETILKRLNDIRLEACKEGVIDPNTNEPLTEADYKPLQWSSDLEAIARLRAAEASVRLEHTRPNGKSYFTARTTNGEQSWAENLAWNYSSLMKGIEQWYGEKEDWVNKTGAVTGHYESIISTRYHYVAVSAFKLKEGSVYPITVAQEFSSKTAMDSQKNTDAGDCVQDMEIAGSAVSMLTFESSSALHLEAGSSHRPVLNATVGFEAYGNKTACTGPVLEGGLWTSSDTAIATVDANGNITAVKSGAATIRVTVGSVSANITVNVFNEGENPLQLAKPSKTTYKSGEQLDLSGGSITFEGNTMALTKNMVSGFRSDTAGVSKVTVTYIEYQAYFDTLIIEEPKLTAKYGQTLSQITLPANEYGKWNWIGTDPQQPLNEVGTLKFNVSFTPYDLSAFSERTDLQAEVSVNRSLEDMGITAEIPDHVFVYDGSYHEPKINVSAGGNELARGEDYTVTYQNNKNAGTGTVIVEGKGSYNGSITRYFEIEPAKLVITAKNSTAAITDIPTTFEYEITGLVIGESLIEEPEFTCSIPSPAKIGIYDIIPGSAKATPNYDSDITYRNGHLIIAEESVAYVVTFDVQGHGIEPEKFIGNAGSVVTQPAEPDANGYIFAGWYQDAACTKAWNFETDILRSDLTLYAKWLMNSISGSFRIQEISDMYYTGKPCKPAVSVYDGDTLLTLNKDYKISYYNNTNANNTLKTGNGSGDFFDKSLPYVTITGKGNYTSQFSVNFNILPAPIADTQGNPAPGVTLKYTDQTAVSTKKNAAPFQSIKFGKAMKKDLDFEISITPANAQEKLEGSVIPAGMTGRFSLEIKGIGNYTGTIRKTVYVMEQSKLIKNAKITLGKNIKSVKLETYKDQQKKVTFEAAYYDQKEKKYYRVEEGVPTQELTAEEQKNYFTVTCGGVSLLYQKDFTVAYERNDRTGTASMIITGTGSQYVGQKAVTFQIKGAAFKANMVEIDGFQTEKSFTGTALTQNSVTLKYNGVSEPLVYGKDYTISYAKNINKGTAAMTFTAMEGSLYTGSFNKTFQILPADISAMEQDDSMKNIEVPYEKAGAKPAAQILLRNPAGAVLQYGRDYTVSYQNIKAAAKANDGAAAPTMKIKGKGNYNGTLERTFTIRMSDLENQNITIEITPMAYNAQKPETFEYKPSIKIKDGKSTLKPAKDYSIEYIHNDQASCTNYITKRESSRPDEVPSILITPIPGSNYDPAKPITLPLPIYLNKLTASTLYVVPDTDETGYTGKQVCPTVQVYYNADKTAVAEAKAKLKKQTPMSDTELRSKGFQLLQKDTDYTCSYGTNISAGSNKGSVTIRGTAPDYGNAVTIKFHITQKNVLW